MLLRCVNKREADTLMLQVHAGTCGPHMNGVLLAKKIMLQGYFWSTMEVDCCQLLDPWKLHPLVANATAQHGVALALLQMGNQLHPFAVTHVAASPRCLEPLGTLLALASSLLSACTADRTLQTAFMAGGVA